MVTDKERCDVARRLREMPNSATWTADRFGEALLQLLVYGNGRESFNRLADLIEPSCNRDALLALADKLKKESWKLQDEFMRTGIERYGYELAIAQQDDWIADCILEACGKYDLNGKE